jgi:hypothetical protein
MTEQIQLSFLANKVDKDIVEKKKLIERISHYLYQNAIIDSLAIGGSFANGIPDKWSDIDLFIVLSSDLDENQVLFNVDGWKNDIGNCVSIISKGIDPNNSLLIQLVFEEFTIVSLHILHATKLTPISRWRTRKIIFDKSLNLSRFIEQQIQYWTIERYLQKIKKTIPQIDDEFWLTMFRTIGYIKRKKFFLASVSLLMLRRLTVTVMRFHYKLQPEATRAPFHYMEEHFGNILEEEQLQRTLVEQPNEGNYIINCKKCIEVFDKYMKLSCDNGITRSNLRTKILDMIG